MVLIAAVLPGLASVIPFGEAGPASNTAPASSWATTRATLLQQYASPYELPPLPAEWTAEQRAHYVLREHSSLGMTPAEWLDWVHATFRTTPRPIASLPSVSLEAATLQLYHAVGVVPSGSDLSEGKRAAAAVPLALHGPLADLILTVAEEYDAQRRVAEEIGALASSRQGDPSMEPLVTPTQRESMMERAERLVDALAVFQSRFEALLPYSSLPASATCLAPVLTDCLVYQGTTGADAYPPNPGMFPDPVLILEPGGNDEYTNSAGGANPTNLNAAPNNLALSIVHDASGDDDYLYAGEPAIVQGAGSVGGMGILVDEDGDDLYLANYTRATGVPGVAVGVFGNGDAGAQGYGLAGFGLLLDEWGHDVYDFRIATENGRCIWGWAQGFGGSGGIGVSSDLWGDDDWLGEGRGIAGGSNCAGTGDTGFVIQGLYVQGVGAAGVGLMSDTGVGDDVYHAYSNATAPDIYGQGYGLAGGLGVMYDDGGTDDFVSSETATTDILGTTLNCAFGSADFGVGVLWVGPGRATYLIETFGVDVADSMGEGWALAGYGLFYDEDGVDDHVMTASAGTGTSLAGRGSTIIGGGLNLFGTYLDAGGDVDVYVGPPDAVLIGSGPGPNNSVWDGGADQ